MKKLILKGIVFMSAFALGTSAFGGTKYKGYKPSPKGPSMTIREPLDRFEETKNDFLISVKGHAAFFTFPKKESYDVEIRGYLNSHVKSKKAIVIEVDPTTSQIHLLSFQ